MGSADCSINANRVVRSVDVNKVKGEKIHAVEPTDPASSTVSSRNYVLGTARKRNRNFVLVYKLCGSNEARRKYELFAQKQHRSDE